MRYSLNGLWQLAFTSPVDEKKHCFSAAVPGNVEMALMENGLLADCMPADDQRATTPYDAVDDWTYSCRFNAPRAEEGWQQELVFEGIDTIAEIYLNGNLIARPRDMFIPHRIPVTGQLKETDNELTVIIRSALLFAHQQEEDIFSIARGHTLYGGQQHLRKARHEWGWDNAPRLLTSGIYRAVYLEYLPPERFEDVYLYTSEITDEKVSLGIIWDYQTPRASWMDYTIRYTLKSKGKIIFEQEKSVDYPRGALRFSLPRGKIDLWWPCGFGEANLCDLSIRMYQGDVLQAEWNGKWGVRTIKLIKTENIHPDGSGEFLFKVNNQPIYINGTNWKPLDALHSRADARVEQALSLIKDLHCNMVRIWGGGIYEDHPFFDFCDENGIMVWQDFMFGCEIPAMDEDYCKIVEKETMTIIKKLRNHPSLAVWCGDNEDDMFVRNIHRGSQIRPSHNKISRQVLQNCVLRQDPYRCYVASSPYYSDESAAEWNAGEQTLAAPEEHLYPATKDFAQALRNCKSRLIGETGPIFINAMTDNPRIWAREENRARRLWDASIPFSQRSHNTHQSDEYFMSWRQTGKELCQDWFRRDFTADEWQDYALAVNIICAHVFKDCIEYCRVSRWEKTGIIWWSLMDMWPMLYNYSVVDYDFRPKMPYYWIRQSQQSFALMLVQKELDGEIALYAANDSLLPHRGEYQIPALSADGTERTVALGSYQEGPNSARMIQRIAERENPELWIIQWQEDGRTYYNHFAIHGKDCGFDTWKAWMQKLDQLYR